VKTQIQGKIPATPKKNLTTDLRNCRKSLKAITNKEVGILQAGMQFGDLALNSDVRR
jgi:ribosomal protein S30